jgi:hypothetical protein
LGKSFKWHRLDLACVHPASASELWLRLSSLSAPFASAGAVEARVVRASDSLPGCRPTISTPDTGNASVGPHNEFAEEGCGTDRYCLCAFVRAAIPTDNSSLLDLLSPQ